MSSILGINAYHGDSPTSLVEASVWIRFGRTRVKC